MHTNRKVFAAGFTTVCLWASGFIGIEISLESYTPAQVALFRFLVASIILFLISIGRPIKFPVRSDISRVFLMGLVGIALYNITLNYGKQFVSSGTASFIVNMAPVFTILFSAVFLNEQVLFRQVVGILVALAGVGVIVIGEGHVGMPSSWVLLLAPLCQSAFFVLQRPLLKRYSVFELISFSIWTGTICMFPLAGDVLSSLKKASLSANVGILYLGIFPSIIGYLCWAYVLSKMEASKAATFLYLIPVVTIVIASLIRRDVINGIAIAGGCLIITGVMVVKTSKPAVEKTTANTAETR